MLRILSPGLIGLLLALLLPEELQADESPASSPVQVQACYEATLEPDTLKISDRIIGYCTSAIAAETDPVRKANLLTDRAILHVKRKEQSAARTDLDESLRLDPASTPARITLAWLFWLEGNLVEAENALTAAINNNTSIEALTNRSMVRRARGDIAGAMRDALTVAGYSPEDIARLTPEASQSAVNEGAAPASVPEVVPSATGDVAPSVTSDATPDDAPADDVSADGAEIDRD